MSVRTIIRRHVRQAPSAVAPAGIAEAVLADLRDDELRDALRIALPYLVRDEIRKLRHDIVGRSAPRGRYDWSDPDEPPPVTTTGHVRARREAGRKGFDQAQAKREREAELLAMPVALAKGVWKALGDCTPEDLHQLAEECRARADENLARAKAYERLSRDMLRNRIARVRDYTDIPKIRDAFAHAA